MRFVSEKFDIYIVEYRNGFIKPYIMFLMVYPIFIFIPYKTYICHLATPFVFYYTHIIR